MKEKVFNVIKWFFIVLGVIFFIQILLLIGTFAGLSSIAKADMTFISNNNAKIKDFQPIIDYVEAYQNKNNKYPEKVENVKVKKGLEYKYDISKDKNCYTISSKTKKDTVTRQYQHCKVTSNKINSSSESYIEFNN